MSFTQSVSEIIGDLERVEDNFEKNGWQFAKQIAQSWVYEIHLKDAILSGDYLRSIAWKEGESSADVQQYVVDSSSNPKVENYSSYVEGGTKYMPARYPAKSAVERVDSAFVQTMDALLDSAMIHTQ